MKRNSMKRGIRIFSTVLIIAGASQLFAQPYNFDDINNLLNDSSSLYSDRIYVEVFQNDTSIYTFQKGWINCSNIALPIASATKWISAGVMLKLAELGWWDLNDSVGTFLPEFTANGKGHITLRQSFSMSSGMFNPGNQDDYHRDPSLTLDQSIDSIVENVDILYTSRTKIGYDGTMMHVWGKVAEVVDEQLGNSRDWRTIAREEFLDLLDMDSTDYSQFLPNPAIAGGIETTPCDYLKFLKMISNNGMFDGQQVLEASSIDEFFTDQTNSAPIYHTIWPHNHPDFPSEVDTMRYTFGAWWTEIDENESVIGLTSPGYYGHYPFIDRCRGIYGTFFAYVPFTQGGGVQLTPTFLRFLKILRENTQPTCLLTEVESKTVEPSLVIFPNPTRDIIHFNNPSNACIEFSIFSLSGTRLKVISSTRSIDLSDLDSGMYILEYELNNHVVSTKIIKAP